MRTTVNLEEDVIAQVKHYALARSMPTGEAINRLLKQALHRPIGTRLEEGFLVFDLPKDTPIATLEDTLRLEDEL
jgi:hypothetical protein